MCINYRKPNKATQKDHFPLFVIDEMLERLANHSFFCYLDDQSKTTFTCPYGTFAYKQMSFGMCNAPPLFQRYMIVIFSVLIEKVTEVFTDDFSVYGKTFDE
jgi:hypothetical protein